VGLGTFGVLVLGARRALRILANPRSATSELRHWAGLSQEPHAEVASNGYEPKHSNAHRPSLPEVPSL
jgi:hypothetical protein